MSHYLIFLFIALTVISYLGQKLLFFYLEKGVFLFSIRNFSMKLTVIRVLLIIIPLIVFHWSYYIDVLFIALVIVGYDLKRSYFFSNGILIGINFFKWKDFDEIVYTNERITLIKSSNTLYKRSYIFKIEKDLMEDLEMLLSKSL